MKPQRIQTIIIDNQEYFQISEKEFEESSDSEETDIFCLIDYTGDVIAYFKRICTELPVKRK